MLIIIIDLPVTSSDKIMDWATEFKNSEETWFVACEEKFKALEQLLTDSKKRVKELEAQRSRLENDLEIRTEKVMQQHLEMEIIRNTPESQDALHLMKGREQYQMKSLQVYSTLLRHLYFLNIFII